MTGRKRRIPHSRTGSRERQADFLGSNGSCRLTGGNSSCPLRCRGMNYAYAEDPMIKANCRDRFTAADFEFVVKTLSKSERDSVNLVDLLTDAEARDSILDSPRLVESVLENGGTLTISPQLYFYVLIRHVLKQTGLSDRRVCDYLASLLETFSQTARMKSPADGQTNPVQYVSDMLIALRGASAA